MIEMQGPGVFLNPPNKPIYQETQTILPNVVVDVGQGVDWGAIGQSASQLGTTLVEYNIDEKRKKKMRLLDDLEAKTKNQIDSAASINDFDSVDVLTSEYKNQVKNIVGYDIESDGGGQTSSVLLEKAREVSYGFDLYRQKARRETSDDVQLAAYRDDSLTFQEQLQNIDDITTFESTVKDRETQLHQMIEDSKNAPQTLGQMAYTAAIRKDLLDLNDSAKRVKEANVKTITEASESKRKADLGIILNLTNSISQEYAKVADLQTQIDSAKASGLEADTKLVTKLTIELNSKLDTIDNFRTTVDEQKNNYAKTYYNAGWSDKLAVSILGKEDYNTILNEQEKHDKAVNLISAAPFRVARERQKTAIESINFRVNTSIESASVRIAAIDQLIDEAQTEQAKKKLRIARDSVFIALENELLSIVEGGVPAFTKDLVASYSGLKVLGSRPLPYPVYAQRLDGTMADAIESEVESSSNIYKVFRPTVDKFNAFLKTRLDVKGGSNTGRSIQQEKNKSILNALKERLPITASREDINEAYNFHLVENGINIYEPDGTTLKPFTEIVPQLQKENIKLPPNGFMHTDFFQDMLQNYLRSQTPVDLNKLSSDFVTLFSSPENAWYGGLTGASDVNSMTRGIADMIAGGLSRPETSGVATAMFLMFTPRNQIDTNIAALRTAMPPNDFISNRAVEDLSVLARAYNGNGDPILFAAAKQKDISILKAKEQTIKQVNDPKSTSALVGKYKSTAEVKDVNEESRTGLNSFVLKFRESVFPFLDIPRDDETLSSTDFNQKHLLGNTVSEVTKDIITMSLGHYYDLLIDQPNLDEKSRFEKVTTRIQDDLNNGYRASIDGLKRVVTPNVKQQSLSSTMIAGSNIDLPGIENSGQYVLNTMLASDCDHNGSDHTVWNQFGMVTRPPDTDRPTALALSISASNGTDISSIPGDRSFNLMAIAEAAVGDKKDNRTMLIAQAAIRDLKNPTTLADAINQVRTRMASYKSGLDSGEYKFFVTTTTSNANKKVVSPLVTLQKKDGTPASSMQLTPLREPLKGTSAHRETFKSVSKEQFNTWAVKQINNGTINHTSVIDYLTIHNINQQTFSETMQVVITDIPSLKAIPTSIPNEDYTYEFEEYLGKKQWYVTQDGGQRVALTSSFDTSDLQPVGKKIPSMLDRVVGIFSPTPDSTGITSDGIIDRKRVVTTVAGKPIVLSYSKPTLSNKWSLETTSPNVTEKEITTGVVDMKETYVSGGDEVVRLKYVKPSSSKTWMLIEGPSSENVTDSFTGRLPKENSIVKQALGIEDPIERYTMIAGELRRQAIASSDKTPESRKRILAADRYFDRAISFMKEQKRLRNDRKDLLTTFQEYVSEEVNQLID